MTTDDVLEKLYGNELRIDVHATESSLPFTLRSTRIAYPVYNQALKEIAKLHHRSRISGIGSGLFMGGQSGSGKTTIIKSYQQLFQDDHKHLREVPQVVIVKTPAAPTVKSVVEAVLNSLGDPVAHRGSTEERTQRIYHFIKQCHVELLAFDEIQHFHDTKRNNERTFFTDWLKNLIDEAHIPVVLVGMPRGETLLKISEQLARRFTRRFYVRPFSFHSKQDQLEFRGLLKNIQLLLPIDSVPLHEANLARRFIFGSAGLIDYVIKTVEEAVSLGYAHGARKIDLKVLAEAYKNAVWPDVPELLNPFNEQATLRRLDRVGEPFELWDRTRVQDKNKAGVNDE